MKQDSSIGPSGTRLCERCTMSNPLHTHTCEMCLSVRLQTSEWSCESCTFVNSTSSFSCDMRNTPNQGKVEDFHSENLTRSMWDTQEGKDKREARDLEDE